MPETPILACEDLHVRLGHGRDAAVVVRGVSLALREGEVFGLVGESGCGKTTLARTLLGLQRETSGQITLQGRVVSGVGPRPARQLRRAVQYVHQDAGAALDPWWSVGKSLQEALSIWGVSSAEQRQTRIERVADAVGLSEELLRRYPHELSGGQLRRVGLARILVLEPKVVLLDEPTAGLDLSVQAAVLNLVSDLRQRLGLTIVFISHDLSVVRRLCDRVAVMYLGRVVEQADSASLFERAQHPYTQRLLQAAPTLDVRAHERPFEMIGEVPAGGSDGDGCAFAARCALADVRCREQRPLLTPPGARHEVACWHTAVTT